MKLFHPRYSGIDVGLGGKQYAVERAGSGAYVNVPEALGHLLFDHGFRRVDAIDIDALARDASAARNAEDSVKKAAGRKG
jgi:hypothetical protein